MRGERFVENGYAVSVFGCSTPILFNLIYQRTAYATVFDSSQKRVG